MHQRGNAVKRIVALLCHTAVLLAAFRLTDSTSGFSTIGLGLTLLFDRYAWRLLPWSALAWKKELCLWVTCFLSGAIVFYFMRPGIVPIREAAYRGAIVCLVVFLLEMVVRFPGIGRFRLGVRGIFFVLLVLLIPVLAALHPLHTVPKRTPVALGLAFEDVRFRTADGMELAAWLIPHPQPRGNLIFCHGHGRNRGHGAGLFQTFHDLGLNVLSFDFRGHGDSDGHTSTFGRREVQDLLAAEAYLSGRSPHQPMLLVGISLGAAVSLQTVGQMPHVRGVWSEGAFARFRNTVDHKFSALPDFLRSPLVDFYYLMGWLDCGFWGPSVNPIDRLNDVRVPILFCHAKKDELVPFTEGQSLYETYQGPKEHWWVEGASHYNIKQRNHQEYLSRLRTFLEECLSGSRTVRAPSLSSGRSRCPGVGGRGFPAPPLDVTVSH
jgi:fermentation-respiration switch protein FrsA (DUF1100 family)